MTAVNAKYVAPVQGWGSEVQTTCQQVDPTNLDTFKDMAVDFVDSQPDNVWTDAFFMTSDSYDLTSCTCMLLTIVYRTMTDEPYNTATSRQSSEMMSTLKRKMGPQNYKILNALRHKNKQRVAANTQESNAAASPSGAQNGSAATATSSTVQQIDGAISSTPSRTPKPHQLYEEDENDNYSEGVQDRGGQQPPM